VALARGYLTTCQARSGTGGQSPSITVAATAPRRDTPGVLAIELDQVEAWLAALPVKVPGTLPGSAETETFICRRHAEPHTRRGDRILDVRRRSGFDYEPRSAAHTRHAASKPPRSISLQ
jgi:hypothetical protein